MRKTVRSWSGNPAEELDHGSEVKSYIIIADVTNTSGRMNDIFSIIQKISELSESYDIEKINYDDEGFTIFAMIEIENPSCCSCGNFDKLKSYFGKIGDIFCIKNN